MKNANIYVLFHPRRPAVPRLVGNTCQGLRVRLRGYRSDARHTRTKGEKLIPSYRWILWLDDRGLRPGIRAIEVCPWDRRGEREEYWRIKYLRQGYRLLNAQKCVNGGDGKPKIFCDKCGMRRKLCADGRRVCPRCVDAREHARRTTPEFRAKARARRQTPEFRAKARARRQTPEFRAKSLAYNHAHHYTPEHRAYQRAWNSRPENRARSRAYCRVYQRARRAGLPLEECRRLARLAGHQAVRDFQASKK